LVSAGAIGSLPRGTRRIVLAYAVIGLLIYETLSIIV